MRALRGPVSHHALSLQGWSESSTAPIALEPIGT